MSQCYRALLFVMLTALVACVPNRSDTLAGNDEDRDIGLGGTGMLAEPAKGLGGTGIVGEITGFGSIFVNGIEIEYDATTPFTVDGEQAQHQQLVIGDVVEVLTSNADSHTRAQQINLRHEVVGTVDTVDKQAASFNVLGQTILTAGTEASLPQPGASVAVSGVRIDEHHILASRVTPADGSQDVVRTANSLPFAKQANRWLVQANIRHGLVAFNLEGKRQLVEVQARAGKILNPPVAVSILELQKNRLGELVLERSINPADAPQGRVWLDPVQRPDNTMQQRNSPMHMNMNIQPGMNRGG